MLGDRKLNVSNREAEEYIGVPVTIKSPPRVKPLSAVVVMHCCPNALFVGFIGSFFLSSSI